MVAFLAAVATPVPIFPPAMVIARHRSLAGRTVWVRGWLDRCAGTSCHLRAAPDRAAARLSLGWSPAFDATVRPFEGQEVVVEGQVGDRAAFNDPPPHPTGEIVIGCIDRCGQLVSPRFVTVLPPARKP